MAVYGSASLESSNVSVAYGATYLSAQVNRIAAAIPYGVYMGFHVSAASTPAKKVVVSKGSDAASFAIVRDAGSPLGLAVVLPDSIEVSAEFVENPTQVQEFSVWLEATYSQGSQTTAVIRFGDLSSVPAGAVRLAKVTVQPGASVIQDSDISEDETDPDVRTVPEPYGSGRHGLIDSAAYGRVPTQDQHDALRLAHAPSASNPYATEADTRNRVLAEPYIAQGTVLAGTTNRVQVSSTCYVGTGGVGTAQRYFDLVDSDGKPLLMPDMKAPTVSAVYDSTNSHELNPGVEADSDGFYQNPVLVLDYGSSSHTFSPGDTVYVRVGLKRSFSRTVDPIRPISLASQGISDGKEGQELLSLARRSDEIRGSVVVVSETWAGADYTGQSGLQSALQSVTNGTVFVLPGTYVISSALNLSSSDVRVVALVGQVTVKLSSGAEIEVSSGKIAFERVTLSADTGASVDSVLTVSGTGEVVLVDCVVTSEPGSVTYGAFVVQDSASVFAERSRFETADERAIDIHGGKSLTFVDCRTIGSIGKSSTGVASIGRLRMKNVYITFADPASGPIIFFGSNYELSGTVEISNLVVEITDFDSGYTGGPLVDFGFAEDVRAVINGLEVSMSSGSVPKETMLSIRTASGSSGSVHVSSVRIAGSAALAPSGIVALCEAESNGATVALDGIDIPGASAENGEVHAIEASATDGIVEIRGLRTALSLGNNAPGSVAHGVHIDCVGGTASNSGSRVLVEDCHVSSDGTLYTYGVYVYRNEKSADAVTVRSCLFSNCYKGIQVGDSSTQLSGLIEIEGNVVDSHGLDSEAYAIDVMSDAPHVCVRGNRIQGAYGTAGVAVAANCGAVVTENVFAMSAGIAVSMASGAKSSVIAHNRGIGTTNQIRAYDADNHVGIGDATVGDVNTNPGMTVTLL